MRHKRFDLSGRGVDLRNLPKLLGVSSNVLGAWSAGHSRPGYLDDISGNNRHLTAGGTTPTITSSPILGVDGNPIQGHSYPGSGSFSLAHDSWMNCFDGDNSVVQIIKTPSTPPAGVLTTFSHSASGSDGGVLQLNTSGKFQYVLYDSGSSPTYAYAELPTSVCDGSWHFVVGVRRENYVMVYCDMVVGNLVACSAYGKDGTRTMYVGSYGALQYYAQPIAYTLLLNCALSHRLIVRAQHLLMGSCAGRSAGHFAVPTFQRASASYCERPSGLVQVPAGWPVQGKDGGQLIEGAVTQLATYTGAFSTNWTKTRCSIAGTSVVLPDGTTGTTNTLHEDGTPASTHPLVYSFSATNGVSYCWSLYVKYNPAAATPREWVLLSLVDSSKSSALYFNIRYGYSGTSIGSMVTRGYGIRPVGDGWFRIWVWGVSESTSASAYCSIHVGEADGDNTFDGLDQDSVFIAFPQTQTGAFPTTYIPCPTTAQSRAADYETWIPWSVSKRLLPCLSAQHQSEVKLHFRGSESLNAATVTPTTGAYSFVKNGRPQNGYTEAEGEFFQCNGSTDFLSLAEASGGSDFDFSTAGQKFSVVVAYTPLQVSSSIVAIVGKWTTGGNKRQWVLTQNTNNIAFSISKSGSAADTGVQVATCLEVGKPVLITATYDGSGGDGASSMTLRVDAATAATSSIAAAPILNSDGDFKIGNYDGYYLNGKLLQLIVLDHGVGGAVVSASEHAAMYTAWKQDGMLPLTMSATTPKTKLIMEFECKCQWSSVADIGSSTNRRLMTIGANTGTASGTRNTINVYGRWNDGVNVAVLRRDTSTTERFCYSGVRTDHNKWASHRFVVNCANLALSTYHVNGIAQTVDPGSMTGAADFNFSDVLIRIGHDATQGSAAWAHAEIRNPKLYAE